MKPEEVLWNYMREGHTIPTTPGAIIHLGNNTQRSTMKRVADIWLQMLTKPLVVVSGKDGRLTEGMTETEASEAARFGAEYGIPSGYILREEEAGNTGDNIKLSLALLAERGVFPQTVLAVQKPFMERRIWGTFQFVAPDIEVAVTSPEVTLEDYPTADFPRDEVIATLVGDVSAIMVYGGKFQVRMEIPIEVKNAFSDLVALGYTKHLRSGYEQYL